MTTKMLDMNTLLLSISYIFFPIFTFLTDKLPEKKTSQIHNNEASILNPSMPPSKNFNLKNFKLNLPTSKYKNGTSTAITTQRLNQGYQSRFFYTGRDGGMVFKCPPRGATTANSDYTRTELREMLRSGDKSISTKGVNKNNWVFSSAPKKDQKAAGAVDGEMRATLAVNWVTTTGDKNKVGRIVIGQIHSNTDEPIRLYYRKLKRNRLGSIYFAHEINNGDDTYYDMIGGRTNYLSNPADGIALNEKFSYKIKVVGHLLSVTISRKGKRDVVKTINMRKSGYDKSGVYHYFKAGIYHLNNTADKYDYAQATFYNLEVLH